MKRDFLKKHKKNLAVFIDRDGTLIEDKGYLSDPGQVQFIPKSIDALKLLKNHNFKLIVITNQSGIARKYLTLKQLKKIHEKIVNILALNNVKLDAIYFCPHHPDQNCFCRKPNIKLALKAARRFNIDLKRSFAVGDKITDVLFAKKFGGKGILVLTGFGKKNKLKPRPDYIAKDFYSAAKWVIRNAKKI